MDYDIKKPEEIIHNEWRQLSDDEADGDTPIPEFLLIREFPTS